MATIAQTSIKAAAAAVNATRTSLTASDTLTFVKGAGQLLVLFNTTGSPVVVTLDGSVNSFPIPASLGLGGSVDVSAGKTVTVPASGTTIVPLDKYAAYLQGTVAITGGTGVTAHLLA